MVHATKGVLVTWCVGSSCASNQQLTAAVVWCSDATMKQFLLFLDKEHHFIIKDLDETHLLVDAAKATLIQEKMNELYEENTYVPIKTDN